MSEISHIVRDQCKVSGPCRCRNQQVNRRALWNLTSATSLALVVIVACYFFVDRPVAFFVQDHKLDQILWLKWLTFPPPMGQTWSPLVIGLVVIRRAWGPLARWQHILFVACVSLILADQFRESLGILCGRDWPETWHDNNPSLIGSGAYGFYPFSSGADVGSFPSGHAARILGFFSVWWIAMPRGRLLCAIIAVPMLVSLIGMNYHFVGDVIAGSFVGGIVGCYATQLGGLGSIANHITHAR